MQIQTKHPPLRLCIHTKYHVKSGLTNVLKNANKTKNMHLFSIRTNWSCVRYVRSICSLHACLLLSLSYINMDNGIEQCRASIGLLESKCMVKQRVRVKVSMAIILIT